MAESNFNFTRLNSSDIINSDYYTKLSVNPQGRNTEFTYSETGLLTSSSIAVTGLETTRTINATGNLTSLDVVSSNNDLVIENSYSGTNTAVGTVSTTLTYNGSAWTVDGVTVSLSDYSLAITSGTPVTNDTLTLTYTTTAGNNISNRLPLTSTYTGHESTIGTRTDTITYTSTGWVDSSSTATTLAANYLTTTATPIVGDSISIVYNTTSGSISDRLTVRNDYVGTKASAGTETETLSYVELMGSWTSMNMPSSQSWYSVCYGNGKFVAVAPNSTTGAYSTDGITWTSMTLPSSQYWYSVAYGDGKFVAIANNSDVGAYSTDGINWTETTMPSSQNWQSVTYGNGKFVAIVYSSKIGAYSTDGINWTSVTLSSTKKSWRSITYGNGKFVTVAFNSNVGAYSTDGLTWAEMTLPSSQSWTSVIYESGKFVVVAQNSDVGAYSTDGINWTSMTLPSSQNWYPLTYGNGKFITIANNSNVGAYSTNGINWTSMTLPSSKYWTSVAYGNNTFVAVASSSSVGSYLLGVQQYWQNSSSQQIQLSDYDLVITSGTPQIDDTINITYTTLADQNIASRLPLTNIYVGPESATGTVTDTLTYTSTGWQNSLSSTVTLAQYGLSTTASPVVGDTISVSYVTALGNIQDRIKLENNYVGVKSTVGTETETLTCIDGGGTLSWTATTMYSGYGGYECTAYGNGKFIATGYGGYSTLRYSTDCINWSSTTLPSSLQFTSMIYGGGKFVGVGYTDNSSFYSTDGVTWYESTLPSTQDWYTVAYGNGTYIAIGTGANAGAYSTDGINWTAMTMPSSQYSYRATYGNDKFVAISGTTCAYSTDGINWSSATLSSSQSWSSITYGNGKFVAISNTYNLGSYSNIGAYSEDGITWAEMTLPSSQDWTSVTYGNGKFVAVASYSTVSAYSTDGISWTTLSLPASQAWRSITYGNGKFFAVGGSTTAAYIQEATWQNSSSRTVTLADYDLVQEGTAITGDTIGLTYTTLQDHVSPTFTRSSSDDTSTRFTCTRDSSADITTRTETIYSFGTASDNFSLILNNSKIKLTGSHFADITGMTLTNNHKYKVSVSAVDDSMIMRISSDSGQTYTTYFGTITTAFSSDNLQNYLGCKYNQTSPLEDGIIDLSSIVYYVDGVEDYRLEGTERTGTFGDMLEDAQNTVVNKEYVGEVTKLKTSDKSSIVSAINSIEEGFKDIIPASSLLAQNVSNTLGSGNTQNGNPALINFTFTDLQQNVTTGTYNIAIPANTAITIELVGGGGKVATTNGAQDGYRDTDRGWIYWHTGGSGAYFKGTFTSSTAGTLILVTPRDGNETSSGDGEDAIAYFTPSGGSSTEIARASGGKSGLPADTTLFYDEVAGGEVTYDEDFFTTITKEIAGTSGTVYKKEFVGYYKV